MTPIGTILNPGMRSSIRQDWATPRSLFYFLNHEFNFSLDVCAEMENAQCKTWIHPDENALSQDWFQLSGGSPCWMNPPYGRKIGAWISKAHSESQRGATVVCLVPARTDTAWWHDYCMKAETRFLRRRLCFDENHRSEAPFPSAIVVFRPPAIRDGA